MVVGSTRDESAYFAWWGTAASDTAATWAGPGEDVDGGYPGPDVSGSLPGSPRETAWGEIGTVPGAQIGVPVG